MTRPEVVALYRAAVLGVDLGGRTVAATRRVLRAPPRRIAIVSAGKSAGPMADAAAKAIRARGVPIVRALVVAPDGALASRAFRTLRAAHPVLDSRSVRAGRAALRLAGELRTGDLLLVLVSGGASAVLAAPRPGVSLADKRALAKRLLASGRPIQSVNRERTRLSAIKGGGLLREAGRARVVALVASDVDGDDPSAVGSGPAAGAESIVVASPRELLLCALSEARARGVRARPLPPASESVDLLAARYARARGIGIAVGEPTVRVRGSTPGGRCAHLALMVARRAAGRPGFLFLAAGSDGRDGPTEAAGACVDGDTWKSLESLRVYPARALRRFESTAALGSAGALIPRWPSPTNLQDVHILVAAS
jgi:hydroxypyruvate reductase